MSQAVIHSEMSVHLSYCSDTFIAQTTRSDSSVKLQPIYNKNRFGSILQAQRMSCASFKSLQLWFSRPARMLFK